MLAFCADTGSPRSRAPVAPTAFVSLWQAGEAGSPLLALRNRVIAYTPSGADPGTGITKDDRPGDEGGGRPRWVFSTASR